ncbi:PepSY-associated TM helix domain-containing protein [Rhodocyclus purpureus]|uniref:PepSY-associated TM helix domain-containing protein n=1 Tax=Rhodocyclus purpureus TaxID=1067 RepID=UPI0019144C7D|nr:PepSY-associated TM helix domain-containing protein [Rhodocyclus purpureus]MBK5915399.1 hypothetical protein [Rhodocyclus purpureus]
MTPDTKAGAARWTKTLHRWHWISSAICLAGLLLFAATGITLNHAVDIQATPKVTQRTAQLPDALLAGLADEQRRRAPLPPPLRAWLDAEIGIGGQPGELVAEWAADEIYLPLPRPGGDAWLRIERDSGAVEYELSERGVIAWLNDLHKGRHTGVAWRWFIDIFSVACLIFALTGLLLLHRHAGKRPATWPSVLAGVAVPALLAFLILH